MTDSSSRVINRPDCSITYSSENNNDITHANADDAIIVKMLAAEPIVSPSRTVSIAGQSILCCERNTLDIRDVVVATVGIVFEDLASMTTTQSLLPRTPVR